MSDRRCAKISTAAGVASGERLAALRGLLEHRNEGQFWLALSGGRDARDPYRTRSRRSSGTIVGVGTGAGKTLAFYLPALLMSCRPAQAKGRGSSRSTRDRTPARSVRGDVSGGPAPRWDWSLGRPIRIGALYGSTPECLGRRPAVLEAPRRRQDLPLHALSYVLRRDSRLGRQRFENQVHVLTCSACSAQVGSDHLVLTRSQMLSESPDVLFTTTEMLNRTLMDGRIRRT